MKSRTLFCKRRKKEKDQPLFSIKCISPKKIYKTKKKTKRILSFCFQCEKWRISNVNDKRFMTITCKTKPNEWMQKHKKILIRICGWQVELVVTHLQLFTKPTARSIWINSTNKTRINSLTFLSVCFYLFKNCLCNFRPEECIWLVHKLIASKKGWLNVVNEFLFFFLHLLFVDRFASDCGETKIKIGFDNKKITIPFIWTNRDVAKRFFRGNFDGLMLPDRNDSV